MIYVLGAIATAYCLGIGSLCWSLWRTVRLVADQSAALPKETGSALPRIDVLIPVKDEEHHIQTCIDSVLAQDYPDVRVFVVNDRSTDGTGRVLQTIAARNERVRVVEIHDLPAGQFGKPHALATVAPELSADIILFIDSDVRVKTGGLSSVVRYLMTSQLDWVAVMGTPELTLFWERVLVPLFGAVAYAWYDPRAINDPNTSIAIGSGFMGATRRAYESIGGHQSVVTEYDEDSALLRLAKKAGQRVSYLIAPDLYSVRFYGGLKKTIHGMTRTCVGGIKTLPRMLVTIAAVNFVALLPLEILAGLAVAMSLRASIPWAALWTGLAILHWAVTSALCWVIYERARSSRWLSLLHPLGASVVIGVCLRAMRSMMRRGPIIWRGTTY